MTYETERLYLKPIDTADAGFIEELYNTPQFIRHIGDRKIRSTELAIRYITEHFLPQFEKRGFGNYIVILKSDGTKIGAAGIFERKSLDVPDIGFSFLEEFQGKGYAYEASRKIKEIGMKDFGLKKISDITSQENLSSQKLIEKLGLVYKKDILFEDGETLRYYES